jgi:hypothetical protein
MARPPPPGSPPVTPALSLHRAVDDTARETKADTDGDSHPAPQLPTRTGIPTGLSTPAKWELQFHKCGNEAQRGTPRSPGPAWRYDSRWEAGRPFETLLDMVVPACNPSTREAEAKDQEFKASLGYIASSGLKQRNKDTLARSRGQQWGGGWQHLPVPI